MLVTSSLKLVQADNDLLRIENDSLRIRLASCEQERQREQPLTFASGHEDLEVRANISKTIIRSTSPSFVLRSNDLHKPTNRNSVKIVESREKAANEATVERMKAHSARTHRTSGSFS